MKPTIVIPYYNGEEYIDRLLETIPDDLNILIADDLSDVPLHLTNNKYGDRVQVIRVQKKGYFTGTSNDGIRAAFERFGPTDVLILNQDVYFQNDGWRKILEDLPASVGMAGDGVFGHPAWPKGYVQGTFQFMRREVIEKLGLMNARDYPVWGASAEYQARVCRAGWEARPIPEKEITGFVHIRTEQELKVGKGIRKTLDDNPHLQGWMIRTPPAVSVIIPCYNHGRFLKDAVDSILRQSFQSFEIIIVDDASTDDSLEIARSLADDWKGIRVVHRTQNGGTPAANNSGIERAYGKFVTILCADDMREEHSIERLYRALEKSPHSIAYDDVLLQFETRQHVWEMRDYDFDSLMNQNFIHAGIMFPRRAWEEIGGYPTAMKHGREDWAMNVGLGRLGYCGIRIPTPGYIYRRHKSNRTLTNTTAEWKAFFRSQLEQLYPDIYSGRKPMGCCGNNRPVQGVNPQTSQPLVGVNGMTLLEYQGGNYGQETYYGPVTGTRYTFSASSRVRNVATEDAPGMLDMVENRRPIFKVYKPAPGEAMKAPVPPAQEEPAPVEAMAFTEAENLNAEPAPVEFAKPANEKPARATARRSKK